MPLPPGSSSFPPQMPHQLRRMVWVDVPNASETPNAPGITRYGPYATVIVPISGGQQVERQGTVTLASDRVYLPRDVPCAAGTIITDVVSGKAYEAQFIQNWPTTVEVLVRREDASL